jgi:hypothetical protein
LVLAALVWWVMVLVLAEHQVQTASLVQLLAPAVAVAGITQKLLHSETVKMAVPVVVEEHREVVYFRAVQEFQVKVLLVVLTVGCLVALFTVQVAVAVLAQ